MRQSQSTRELRRPNSQPPIIQRKTLIYTSRHPRVIVWVKSILMPASTPWYQMVCPDSLWNYEVGIKANWLTSPYNQCLGLPY